MRNPARTKAGVTSIKHPFVVKGLAVLFFLCILIRVMASLADAALSGGLAARLMEDGDVAGDILSFELGDRGGESGAFTTLLFGSPLPEALFAQKSDAEASGDGQTAAPSSAPVERTESPAPADIHEPATARTDGPENNGGLFYTAPPSAAQDAVPDPPRDAVSITLDNTTSYAVDIEGLLGEPLNIKLTEGAPAVLIIHTHTSEAYTKSDGNEYVESDPFRTEDKSRNITRVGEELAAELESRGIGVIHDRRSYDYPSYTGSYNRTYSSVREYMKQYPSIKLVLDLHRDSITASDGSQYKTIAQIGDMTCSQVMFVVGSDAAGLEHPSWRENLKLALNLQSRINDLYPSLARPVRISQYRYNQQLMPGSLILEVGCAGNTLEESLAAVRFFADAAANLFLELYW